MNILDRMVFFSFIRAYFICLTSTLSLYIIVDLFTNIDAYAIKANGDPHGITRQDVEALRVHGVTDAEIVETLETVNTGNAFNLINGALNVGPDDFLGGYKKERGEQWQVEEKTA